MLIIGKFLKTDLPIKPLLATFKREFRNDVTNSFFSSIHQPFNSNIPAVKKSNLLNSYKKYKEICGAIEVSKDLVNPKGIFCNNEIDLKDIHVYGFDYDYTLAYYNVSLYNLIFNLARDILIDNYKYPNELRELVYLPNFPIRGLHLDKRKGWLMKIDSYHNIQLNSVYYGMNPVSDDEISKFYGGLRLNIDDIGFTQSSKTLHQYVDLFCLPEISLLAQTTQYFCDKSIHFNPEYIFLDVNSAISTLHRSQILHKNIVQSIDDYLLPIKDSNNSASSSSIHVKEFLKRLNQSGKSTFLITNSPYWFVNFGMQSLLGSDWTNYFDLIICNARKPDFFTSKSKMFRQFNIKTNSKSWEKVTKFKKNEIYYEGNLLEMMELTGWKRNSVLYFGDHIYGDLAEPFLKHGWRTGAIINEIEREVEIFNQTAYQRSMVWLVTLENLIEKSMFLENDNNPSISATESESLLDSKSIRKAWLNEREELRNKTKRSFNPCFGSVFRTYNNPSFFSRRLSRFADIYTSNVTNLLNYPVDCHFIPRRFDLAHEKSIKIKVDIDY